MLKPKMQTEIFKLAPKYSSSFWTVYLSLLVATTNCDKTQIEYKSNSKSNYDVCSVYTYVRWRM
jgi:hypothetical protein